MKRTIGTALIVIALASVAGAQDETLAPEAALPIAVDGMFEDWNVCQLNLEDPRDDGGDVDFGGVLVRSNEERVTFLIDVGTEINLQGVNSITMLIDCDADASTGRQQEGLGADFGWTFGRREGRAWSDDDAWKVDQNDIGFLQAPTVSSTVFEISFLRRSASGHDIVMGDRIAFVLIDENGDRMPDTGATVVELSNEPAPPPLPVTLERKDPGHLRVVTWNVLFDGLFERPAPFIRVLRALDPDVVCFQEIWSHTARQAADYVSLAVPEADWYGMHTDEGQIVSRYPFRAAEAVDDAGNYWALVDLPDDRFAVDLSVVCAHPPCCDKEIERQAQLDGIAAWTRDTMIPGPSASLEGPPMAFDLPWGTPVIITGDMNLVGGADQVLTLTEGRIADERRFGPSFAPDWDGTPFADSWARVAGGVSVATWRDARSAYAPGKLDYTVYSDSVLELERAFILDTELLEPAVLSRYGLHADDTLVASDHLPVVTDFTPLAEPSRTEAAE